MKYTNSDLESIKEVIFISDDAIGPVTKSAVVVLGNGKTMHLEGIDEVFKFCSDIRGKHPQLAGRIEAELMSTDNPNNYEILFRSAAARN